MLDMLDDNFTGALPHHVSKNDFLNTMEEKIRKLEEMIEKLKTSQIKCSNAMYVEGFLSTFKDDFEVTKKDIEKYTMSKKGIHDRRAIRNHTSYLEALNIIKESTEPDVYIIIENYL